GDGSGRTSTLREHRVFAPLLARAPEALLEVSDGVLDDLGAHPRDAADALDAALGVVDAIGRAGHRVVTEGRAELLDALDAGVVVTVVAVDPAEIAHLPAEA